MGSLKLRFLFPILFLSFYGQVLLSQEVVPKLNFVNIKDGISKVGVYSIVQDKEGFIWIGTNGSGLYRYSGMDFKIYKHELYDKTSLNSSLIFTTYIDSNNRLWVGTEEGLNLYDRDNDRFKRIKVLDGGDGANTISISSLQEDSTGHLYIGGYEKGLFRLDMESFKVEKVGVNDPHGSSPLVMQCIKRNRYGKIYVGTNRGLFEIGNKSGVLKRAYFQGRNNRATVSAQIKSLLIDDRDNIWIGSFYEGLYKVSSSDFDGEELFKIDKYVFTQNPFFTIITLPDGTLMCGTENDGLFHINEQGDVLNHYLAKKDDKSSILSNSIWSLYVDDAERIWLGYYNKGIALYDKLYDKFEGISSSYNNPNSLQISSVSSISEDATGKLWIGMDGGGIDVLDQRTNTFIHINSSEEGPYSGLTSDYIQSILIDGEQNIWAGSWESGIYLLKKGSKKFINFNLENTNGQLSSNTVTSITEDSKGTIWIGTYRSGLHSYNPVTGQFVHYSSAPFIESGIVNSDIWKVLVDSRDNIWLGTTRGLFRVGREDKDNFSVTPMTDKMPLEYKNNSSANHILSLYEGADKILWIGTKGAGMFKFDPRTEIFTWYNTLNGLKEVNVCSIVQSLDGNIWVSGNSGITKLNIETDGFTNYNINDGLLSNDFNMNSAFRDEEGRIYFGGYQGIDFFDPQNIKTNTHIPPLYLSDFKLFNEKTMPGQKGSPLKRVISETDSIVLTHKQSVFTLEYSGINFTRPEENVYAYYLEGYEKSWNFVGEKRSATYTNLDPGDYIFKLKAANNDGVWSEKPLRLFITVLPPWWKASWAIISYVVLFIFGIYLLNKLTSARLREKQLINTEREKRLREKDMDEKKFQFFTNISHEFRTPLTLILNPIQDIIRDESLSLPQRIREKHQVIHKNTDRLYRLVNELLDFRKLELNKIGVRAKQLNVTELTREILSHFASEAFERNIHLSLDTDLGEQMVWSDPGMLEKIIFNILSNAFKVTPEGGAITVQLLSSDSLYELPLVDEHKPTKGIEMLISDTGPGLEKEELTKIFERFYQVENLNKSYYGGTGIGLEVVQNFVNLLKGKIEVKSEVGEGTTFKIVLPIHNVHLMAENALGPEHIKDGFKTDLHVGETTEIQDFDELSSAYTLLIVEDNNELRNYLRTELKGQYKVLLARNGKEGLSVARTTLPDIIIADIMMPEMNGLDFCKKIKGDIKTSHIPLMMLTAKALIDDRMEGIQMGADAYMVKPFDMRLLKLRLSQLITSRQLIFNKYFSVISDVPVMVNTSSLDKEFIEKVLNYINKNIDDPELSVETMASQLNLSRSQFYRKIKALTNQSAAEFLRNIRLQKAKQMIENGNSNITDVCYKVGFTSPSYFTKCFKNYFEQLPTDV
tara:strand:+ start:100861 stop:105012 length:4152 start_codon:yes stop_codon:yes gene_type:complete